MGEHPPKVITIPAKPNAAKQQVIPRQLRVAAYCRVSTDDEEQLTSYEAQQTYYTDKIMTNRDWTMAGIFADEGITGTSARKRPEFLRLPPLPYPGRGASPTSHPLRHQLRHEPKDFPHPPNYVSHGIGAGSCPWPKYEPCRYRAAAH